MTQSFRQREALSKVQIGIAYTGARFDRPAVRQLPRDWVLEEAKPKRKGISPDAWVLIACAIGCVFCLVHGFLLWRAGQ